MTATVWIGIASLVGAALFFVAGAALTALRQQPRSVPDVAVAAPPVVAPSVAAAPVAPSVAPSVAPPVPVAPPPAPAPRVAPLELAELSRLRAKDSAQSAELDRLRGELAAAAAKVQSQQGLLEEQAAKLKASQSQPPPRPPAPSPAPRSPEPDPELVALRERAAKLQRELDTSRSDAIAAARDLEQAQGRLRDAERQLAEKTQAARDLSTENEQLKGRLRDAEALRADYVRLRTSVTEAEYLKGEVERLEKELRSLRVDALGAQRTRPPARGTEPASNRESTRPPRTPTLPPATSIGESLTHVLEKFADTSTRSLAIGDTQGFPLASSGADGVALAAYAALLIETASRADDFLPIASPTTIEIRDERGTCVSVWAFDVESERLLLANLAVSPADTARVQTTLAALTSILAPPRAASGSAG